MKQVNSNTYVTLQPWVSRELKIKGAKYLVYCVVLGFTQFSERGFDGSSVYLSDVLGISRPTARTALADLVTAGFVKKIFIDSSCGYDRYAYRAMITHATHPYEDDVPDNDPPDDDGGNGGNDDADGSPKSPAKDTPARNPAKSPAPAPRSGTKNAYGKSKNVFLSDDELALVCGKFGNETPAILDYYSEKKKSYSIKNDYLALTTWNFDSVLSNIRKNSHEEKLRFASRGNVRLTASEEMELREIYRNPAEFYLAVSCLSAWKTRKGKGEGYNDFRALNVGGWVHEEWARTAGKLDDDYCLDSIGMTDGNFRAVAEKNRAKKPKAELPADYFDNVSEWVLMDEEERESLAKEGDAPKKGEKTYSMADLAKFIDEMKAKREEKSEKQREEAMSAESKAMELRRIAEEAFRNAGVAVSV